MKRSLTFSLLGTFLLGGLLWAALRWLSPLPPPPSPAQPASTLLVLGAAQVAGLPSPAFRRRLGQALRLYQQGGVTCIIVSGGVGGGVASSRASVHDEGDLFSEGEIGVRYLRAQGVPIGVLRAEEQSRTTYQNLRNSRPLIHGRVTLVTDEIHARRALALAQAEGLSADVSSVSLRAAPRYLLRETAALLMWRLFGYTGGRPASVTSPET